MKNTRVSFCEAQLHMEAGDLEDSGTPFYGPLGAMEMCAPEQLGGAGTVL